MVGERARDPDSYLRLYALPRARGRLADPAGPKPAGWDQAALWRYNERVRRYWSR